MKGIANHTGTLIERRAKYVLINQIKDNYLWRDSPITTKEELLTRMALFVNKTDAEVISIQDSLANTFPRLVCKRKELLEVYHQVTGYKYKFIIQIEPGFGEKECLAYSYFGELKVLFNLFERTHDNQKPEALTLFDDSAINMQSLALYKTKASSIQSAPDGYSAKLNCFIDVKGGIIKPENRGELYTISITNNLPDDILSYTNPAFLSSYKRNLCNALSKFSDQAIHDCITKINALKTADVSQHLEEIFVILVDVHSYLNQKNAAGGIIQKQFAGTISYL